MTYIISLSVSSMGKQLYENDNLGAFDDYDKAAEERKRIIKEDWEEISRKIEKDTGVKADKQVGMFFIDKK